MVRSLIFFVLLLVPLSTDANRKTAGLEVHICASPLKAVVLNDTLSFTVNIENTSKSDLAVFREVEWGSGGGLSLVVTDVATGTVVARPFMDHAMLAPTVMRDPKRYVVLKPSTALVVKRTDKVANLVTRPGRYRVIVLFRPPNTKTLSPRLGPSVRVVDDSSGVKQSNVIEINVMK